MRPPDFDALERLRDPELLLLLRLEPVLRLLDPVLRLPEPLLRLLELLLRLLDPEPPLLDPLRDFEPLLRLLELRPPLDLRPPPELLFERDDDEEELDFFRPLELLDFDDELFFFPAPFAPPVSLLTVAHARRAASLLPTPFSS